MEDQPRGKVRQNFPQKEAAPKNEAKGDGPFVRTVIFRRYFRHWRTGKLMDAHDYGLRGWPIGANN